MRRRRKCATNVNSLRSALCWHKISRGSRYNAERYGRAFLPWHRILGQRLIPLLLYESVDVKLVVIAVLDATSHLGCWHKEASLVRKGVRRSRRVSGATE